MAFRFHPSALASTTLFLLLSSAAPAKAGPPPPTPKPHGTGTPQHPQLHHALKTAKLDLPAHRATPGRSVGSPTDGHLLGGSHLTESPYLRIVPVYQPGDARWGIEPLVSLIDHSARAVRKQFPDAVLSVGHLSRAGGGEIDRHASHESGRDADIGFYVRNQTGKPIYADHFVAFKGDGSATSWPGAQFDDPRNWALVSTIAGDAHARVTHIFVALPLRARLLSYAEKIGAPPALRNRAAELMAQPKGSLPHDDHFHVRIACPSGMEKCVEQPLARKHGHHGGHQGALARHQTSADGAGGGGGGGAHHMSKPPPGHGHGGPPMSGGHSPTQPPPKHTAPESRESSSEPETSKSEALVPSLAPMVPGLDSAIIPAPLAGLKPEPEQEAKPAAGAPESPPIDDPDGVLEKH